MTLVTITKPSATKQQMDAYNSSDGTRSATYSPPAGTDWAVIGLVLNDAVVPGDEATLVAGIEALGGITSVANPRFWGQLDAAIEINPGGEDPDTHEILLHTTARLSCFTGFASNNYSLVEQKHATTQPALGKKWMVVNAILPSAFADQAAATALQSALTGVTGIAVAKVMVFGAVPDAATQVGLAIESRMRIDRIPEA